MIARLIWSDVESAPYSPYRFCNQKIPELCNETFSERMYILDFAGGGAVHLVGTVISKHSLHWIVLIIVIIRPYHKLCMYI